LGGSIHTIRKNTEALLIASKEIGLEVNAEKTKYMVMSQDQNTGQNGNIQIGHKSSEAVEQLKQGSGEDYITRSFMLCTPFQISFGSTSQED
jgi:hypothetical protein